ncbi:MAG: hypothetical protein WC637_10355 [Victivallales bacterium]|jgi:hypothetical protein
MIKQKFILCTSVALVFFLIGVAIFWGKSKQELRTHEKNIKILLKQTDLILILPNLNVENILKISLNDNKKEIAGYNRLNNLNDIGNIIRNIELVSYDNIDHRYYGDIALVFYNHNDLLGAISVSQNNLNWYPNNDVINRPCKLMFKISDKCKNNLLKLK